MVEEGTVDISIIEKLNKLRLLRWLESTKKQERDEMIRGLAIVNEIEVIKSDRENIEAELRETAVTKYLETGLKRFGQLGIRITTKYDYDDSEALEWAKKHELCLALDKTAFKKQLKVQPLDFVKSSEVPTATIPTEIKEELIDGN